jgi:hypothetical protein
MKIKDKTGNSSRTFLVVIGFNVLVGEHRPKSFRPAKLIFVSQGYELRYDAGVIVDETQLPTQVPIKQLIHLGVLRVKVKPPKAKEQEVIIDG